MWRRAARVGIGFAIILLALGAGEWVSRVLRLPLPGSVVGMLLLTGALRLGAVPLALVQPASSLLIRWMALFFVPAGAAVVLHGALLRANWLALVAAGLASVVAVLLVTGLIMQRLAEDD